ncbi:hemolysin activation/secretion protein, partial [Cupriavidus basilensis OR16]
MRSCGLACGLLVFPLASQGQAPGSAAQELLRQQERERVLREQQESTPDVRVPMPAMPAPDLLPKDE